MGKKGSSNFSCSKRKEIRYELMQKQKGYCFICYKKMKEREISIDHYIPLSFFKERGLKGGNKIKNLVLVHRKCNIAKGSKLPLSDNKASWEYFFINMKYFAEDNEF
jgi:5-methylcytosine-specific restriction endonuclease McrA